MQDRVSGLSSKVSKKFLYKLVVVFWEEGRGDILGVLEVYGGKGGWIQVDDIPCIDGWGGFSLGFWTKSWGNSGILGRD